MNHQFFDGTRWVIKLAPNVEIAGRTPEQAQRTANLIMSGQVIFDGDGIGQRLPEIQCPCCE